MPGKLSQRFHRVITNPLLTPGAARMTWDQGPALSICCDDGRIEDHYRIRPILEQTGVCGVFAVSSGLVGTPGYMQAHHLQALAGAGHEVASHGVMHERLVDLGADEQARLLDTARRQLEDMTGAAVNAVVYPYGANDFRTRRLARTTYRVGVSAWPGINHGVVHRQALRRVPFGSFCHPGHDTPDHYKALVDQTVACQGWLILMLHTFHPHHDQAQDGHLRALIAYAQARSVRIGTLSALLPD